MSCAGMLGKQCSCGKWHETVDNGLPIQMYEGTLDEPIRKWNVIASVSWIGIVLAVLGGLLWGLWSTP